MRRTSAPFPKIVCPKLRQIFISIEKVKTVFRFLKGQVMRMRKKKHTDDRIVACGALLIEDPSSMPGKWQELAKGRKLCLEIGCGKGTFVCETAKRNPDKFFIAVEKVRDVMVMAMEKAKNAELENVVFSDIDAEKLCEVFDENELSEIYLNFSDPWPKKKHAKRRLTFRSFLNIYRHILCDDGVIFFKTDNRPLFDFSLEEMHDSAYSLSDVTYDLHNSQWAKDNVVTEYEANFSAKGFSINRVVARPLPVFEKVVENIFCLQVPFDGDSTSVFAFECDEGTVIFDSATTEIDVDERIIPAIRQKGFEPTHIISSHFHSDHMGGEEFLAKEYPDAIRAKLVHDGKIENGKKVLCDGDIICDCLKIVTLPGHSDDSAAILDTRTNTLVCADCLQLWGIGKYGTGVSLAKAYLESIEKVRKLDVENIIASHCYAPLGAHAFGKEAVKKYLDECEKYISVLKSFAEKHSDLAFDKMAELYNAENPDMPKMGAHTFEAIAKEL